MGALAPPFPKVGGSTVCARAASRNYNWTICDRLWINHPSTAKLTFWVRPKMTARSACGRYLVYVVGVIYSVLATLCRSTKRQLSIVSPGVI